jgi:hypothetical protein
MIIRKSTLNKNSYNNAVDPSAIAAAVGQVFGFGSQIVGNVGAKKEGERQLALEKERARQAAIAAGMNRKTDFIPIIVIGGVLLIGGIVVITTLKK